MYTMYMHMYMYLLEVTKQQTCMKRSYCAMYEPLQCAPELEYLTYSSVFTPVCCLVTSHKIDAKYLSNGHYVFIRVHTCLLLSNFKQISCSVKPSQHSRLQRSCCAGFALQLLCTCTCTKVKAPIHEATLLLATVACNNV